MDSLFSKGGCAEVSLEKDVNKVDKNEPNEKRSLELVPPKHYALRPGKRLESLYLCNPEAM